MLTSEKPLCFFVQLGGYQTHYEEFRLKEFERDRDGTWVDEIPDGNDHSIDAVRYAVIDDVLRGT